MGADTLHLTPCCKTEQYHYIDEKEGKCKCSFCDYEFYEDELIKEEVIYENV